MVDLLTNRKYNYLGQYGSQSDYRISVPFDLLTNQELVLSGSVGQQLAHFGLQVCITWITLM